MREPTCEERMLGGLWGALVGDALGVPVEFQSRDQVQRDPVTDMRGFGTHRQPPGTWSDDSSLLLCSAESLVERGDLDSADMGARFVRWKNEAHWTPHGSVFDIGVATSTALSRIASGTPPEQAGGADERSNGNGSLMRILPVALWFSAAPTETLLDRIHRASAITHRHPRSQMACGLFALLVRELLTGTPPADAHREALTAFCAIYTTPPFLTERPHFHLIESGRLASTSRSRIASSGYVLDTLTASVWSLLTSASFGEATLNAVNLGDDTDTTGCVTGALAGVYHGLHAIPHEWLDVLAQRDKVAALLDSFILGCSKGMADSHGT